ncbi:helix-turn-helix transcriptional regulator [Nanoarchaeota archaeon]
MENKHVGYIIIGIAVLLVIIIFLFQNALKDVVELSCGLEHGESCPMKVTVDQQTYLALGIVGLLVIIALVLIFTKPKEKVIIKTVKEKKKKLDLKGLDRDEKKVINLLIKENKAMFQKDLMENLEIGKVKTTRLLDKLEAKQFIERKRRGMNNIVVLRD